MQRLLGAIVALVLSLGVIPTAQADALYGPNSTDIMNCLELGPFSRMSLERDPGHFGCGVLDRMNPGPLSRIYASIADVRNLLGNPQVELFCPRDPRAYHADREAGAVVVLDRPFDPKRMPALTNTLVRDAMRRAYARCPVMLATTPAMGFIQIAAPAALGGPLVPVAEVRNYGLGVWNDSVFGPQARQSVVLRWTGPAPERQSVTVARPAAAVRPPSERAASARVSGNLAESGREAWVGWAIDQGVTHGLRPGTATKLSFVTAFGILEFEPMDINMDGSAEYFVNLKHQCKVGSPRVVSVAIDPTNDLTPCRRYTKIMWRAGKWVSILGPIMGLGIGPVERAQEGYGPFSFSTRHLGMKDIMVWQLNGSCAEAHANFMVWDGNRYVIAAPNSLPPAYEALREHFATGDSSQCVEADPVSQTHGQPMLQGSQSKAFLQFPLDCADSRCSERYRNGAYTAGMINSILDHSLRRNATSGALPYGQPSDDGKDEIVAYDGERASGRVFDGNCLSGAVNLSGPDGQSTTNASGCQGRPGYASYDDHPGYDYRAALGTPVRAAAAGRVLNLAGQRCYLGNMGYDCTQWGFVGIDHGNGYVSQYGHLSRILVGPGDAITKGQLIGYSGATAPQGKPIGPHLHFEVWKIVEGKYLLVDPYGWSGEGADPLYSVDRAPPAVLWAP